MMEVYKYTNIGGRESNQDYAVFETLSDGFSIFVVADGMGGYQYGEVASRVVGDAIVSYVISNRDRQPAGLLREAVSFANESLMLKRISLSGVRMGTVVAVLLIVKDSAYVSWLGDSRVYMFRDGLEVFQTEDHSLVNEMAKLSRSNFNVEDLDRLSHIVSKAIMGDDDLGEIPVAKVDVKSGDCFILCSDGFYRDFPLSCALNYIGDDSHFEDRAGDVSDNFTFIKVRI